MAPTASAPDKKISAVSFLIALSLQILGWEFALQLENSDRSNKSHWFLADPYFYCHDNKC